ncbi:MAG TPA: zinc ribbon domain-containing protein [Steroidobacteraceae bacterium]|jgi:putative FmdB family regulatory protein|nr:zinc ribbon domain-containing protein [Steroidobacteraceae bacterium]
MPFYEYQCKSCGHELEAMQKVSDAPLKKCPHCGKSQLTRLMSAPVFRLKGGGWYETDFKGDKDNQRNLADRPEDAPKDAKDTETKAKDEKGKDGKDAKSGESKADASSAKESPKPTDKPADKPADKSSPGPAQKPASGKGGTRSAARSKRKPIKVKRRR